MRANSGAEVDSLPDGTEEDGEGSDNADPGAEGIDGTSPSEDFSRCGARNFNGNG